MSEFSEFSDYLPIRPADASPVVGAHVAEATADDLPAIAALTAEREGGSPEQYSDSLARQLTESNGRLFVARERSRIVAFSRVTQLDFSSVPSGWYLSGLIVSRAHRRRGIGRALTEHRLRWLASRTERVYYFANEWNRPTIDLHAHFGFQEIKRGITVPGCTFNGGEGVLFLLSPLSPPHDE